MRAISVLGNAKSKRHRKTHQVEPDGTEPKMFMHLTRGGLLRESVGEVSRDHSSEESRGNTEGAKGRRTSERAAETGLRQKDGGKEARNGGGAATAAATPTGERRASGRIAASETDADIESSDARKEEAREKMLNEVTMEAVVNPENLRAAYRAVKTNGGACGVDGMKVEEMGKHLKAHGEKIVAKLLAGQYQPAAVRAVEIPKASGGKRLLGIPTVIDRMIEQAIHQAMGPTFEEGFSESSYGFRPGRSAHDAVRAAHKFVKAGKKWVVDIDLKSFFDQVNHDRLMTMIGRKVRDKRVLALIGRYLRAEMQRENGSREARKAGTPQGGPLSPLLANIYLDPLDKELEKRGVCFVRYADDIAIFAASPRSAERIYESVVRWLKKELGLEVNREKSGTGPSGESSLLGFRLYEDGRIGISPKSIEKLKVRVRECWEARQNKTSKGLSEQWQSYIRGWWNYFQLADWRREVQNLSGWIRRHMRKCFWLRWHDPRGRINALKRLGVKGRSLGMAYSGLGAWAIARHWVMHQALKTKTLHSYGFIIPWDFAESGN